MTPEENFITSIIQQAIEDASYNGTSKKKLKHKKILIDLKYFKKRVKISSMPNITQIIYGRKVGYKITKINLPDKIQKISATNIRKKMRKERKLS